MKEKINQTRILLDNLVSNDNAKLSQGRILEISKELDMLISAYYEEAYNYGN